MIHNPARVAHKIIGGRYISLIQIDGEYELAVFTCRIVNEKPVVGTELSTTVFSNLEDAMNEYKGIVSDLKYKFDF